MRVLLTLKSLTVVIGEGSRGVKGRLGLEWTPGWAQPAQMPLGITGRMGSLGVVARASVSQTPPATPDQKVQAVLGGPSDGGGRLSGLPDRLGRSRACSRRLVGGLQILGRAH